MRPIVLYACLLLLLCCRGSVIAHRDRHRHAHSSSTGVYDPHNDKDRATHREVRHLTQPDWDVYHTAADIDQLVNDLAERHSEYVIVTYPYRESLPPHQHHPSSRCAHLPHGSKLEQYCNGHRLQRVTVTAPGGRSQDKLQVLLVFGEHGRELISSEIAVSLLRLLTAEESHHQAGLSTKFRQFILQHVEFTVLPLLNIYGHEQVEAGQTCQRKNVNGGDSNRNFPFHFNNTGSTEIASDWPGPAPFSEIESSFVRSIADDLTTRGSIELYANVHSGIEELLCGWDYEPVPIDNYRQVHRMMAFMQKHHCPTCRAGVAGVIGGYEVFGGSMDWMYVEKDVDNSLTLEVYQGKSQRLKDHMFDCFPSFNPVSAHEMHKVSADWASSFITASVFLLAQQRHIFYPDRLPNYLLADASLLQPHTQDDSVWTHILPSQQDPEPSYLLVVTVASAAILTVAVVIVLYRRWVKSQATSYQPVQ